MRDAGGLDRVGECFSTLLLGFDTPLVHELLDREGRGNALERGSQRSRIGQITTRQFHAT